MNNEFDVTVSSLQKEADLLKLQQELDAKQAEIEAGKKRIADLELKDEMNTAAAAERQRNANLRLADKTAEKHEPLNLTQLDLHRNEAIRRSGGLAFWNKKSLEERTQILSLPHDDEATDKNLKEVFGRTSSSKAASQLAASNPTRYKLWRAIAREKGII
jgi:hypothetical protein